MTDHRGGGGDGRSSGRGVLGLEGGDVCVAELGNSDIEEVS